MKKKLLILFVMCGLAMVSQATTLRVNNTDPSAPYASINDAVNAATEGDTIMVEGSSIPYGDVTINKRVVLIGPGYWLKENGIITETGYSATVKTLTSTEAGTVIMGMSSNYRFEIKGAKTIIKKCNINSANYYSIYLSTGADNCVITQNYLSQGIGGNDKDDNKTFRHQITNNIVNKMELWYVYDSYVGYNTILHSWDIAWDQAGNKMERNLVQGSDISQKNTIAKQNTFVDNYFAGSLFKNISTDKDVLEYDIPDEAKAYGAFAGDNPYVISGIPAGPIIEELTIPTSAEEGSSMEVAIKLGTVK